MHSVKRLAQRLTSNPVRLAVCILAYLFLLPFGYLLGSILHIPGEARPFFAAAACFAIVVLMNWVIPGFWTWVKSSINVTWFAMHYAADRTVGVSHVEAMISAGDYDDAAEEIDALLAKHGVEACVCHVGLDLHLGKFGSRERGAALLRRMRAEKPEQYEKMSTQRLIDLYIAQPETHGKALTELRRLAAKFPGTPEAAGALLGIEQLKPQLWRESPSLVSSGTVCRL